MISENLFEKIVDRMRESETDDEKECLAEVYCEILRELRDKLYIMESKVDELHAKSMDETLIAKIADNLIVEVVFTGIIPKVTSIFLFFLGRLSRRGARQKVRPY